MMSAETNHAKRRDIKRPPISFAWDLLITKSVARAEGPAMRGMAIGTTNGSLCDP